MNLISWTSKLPALQTPTEVKEREGPLEIDSSPPDSPDSASSMTNSKDAVVMAKEPIAMRKAKVNLNLGLDWLHYLKCFFVVVFLQVLHIKLSCIWLLQDVHPRTAASSTPIPTIVRPGSLALHQGFDAMNPTQPSPTSVITRTPPSNRLRYKHSSAEGTSCLKAFIVHCSCLSNQMKSQAWLCVRLCSSSAVKQVHSSELKLLFLIVWVISVLFTPLLPHPAWGKMS